MCLILIEFYHKYNITYKYVFNYNSGKLITKTFKTHKCLIV